jgi:hypothetical protein
VQTSTDSTTQASSNPSNHTSDNTRDRKSIYRGIIKDELKLFDEAEIEYIVE